MTTEAGERTGLRAWAGLAVLALPTALLGLDVTVMYLAEPVLAAELRPGPVETLWIMDAYGFLVAGFLITMGSLGDRIGRRRLLLIGAAAFGLVSVVAAFSTAAPMLIAARAALGIAGATLMPSTLALISVLFPDARRRALAFGIWATMFALGMAAGPLAGGLLLERFWWGSVFLLALPVVALVLVTGPFLLPEYRDPDRPGRIDPASVVLSLVAVLSVVYAVKHAAADGPDVTAAASLVAGVGFGALFVRRQQRLADPLLELRLLTLPAVGPALVVLLGGLVGVGGALLLVTQHLQLVEGLTPRHAGLWMGPPAAMMLVAAVGAPLLARRWRPGPIVAGALVVSALGHLLLALVGGPGSIGLVVAGFGLVYAGLGVIAALGTDLVVGGAPAERAGSASALSETVQELGIAAGVAVLGSVAGAVYRATVAVPPGLTAAAADAYRGSLSGAVSAGAAEAGPVGAAGFGTVAGPGAAGLLDGARAAQDAGLQVASATAAAGTFAMAVLAAVVLRRVRSPGTG